MTSTDASLNKLADKDLAKEATLTSIIFLLAWIIVVYTTVLADDLPLLGTVGVMLFVLLVGIVGTAQAKLYRWVDEDGKVHYSDKVPPQAIQGEHTRLNERGIPVYWAGSRIDSPGRWPSAIPLPDTGGVGRTGG